ncbi:MAG: SpoIIE family protein phosphatase [Planctomycetaceae bacterium]|nr:SpoIIE family protein phosphatase [Planctomycetaceae bacterium]
MSPLEKSSSPRQLTDECAPTEETLCWRLFDEIPIALFTIDDQLRILSVNRCFQSLTHYSHESLVGQSILMLLQESTHGSPDEFLNSRMTNAVPCNQQPTAEFEFKLENGDTIPIDLRTNRVDTSSYRLLLCSAIDVTERTQSRTAMLESQNRLREILDNTETCVYVKDLEGRYQFVNRRFEELFQLQLDDVISKTDSEIFPQALAEIFRKNDVEVVKRGETIQVKEIAPHEDGPHLYLSSKFPLRNPRGEIHAVAGISTDITQMDQQEREVERLKSSLELILNSVSDGIIGGNRAGGIEYMNRAARLMLGLSAEEEGEIPPLKHIQVRTTPGAEEKTSLPELLHSLVSASERDRHFPNGSLHFPDGTSVPTDVTCGVTENDRGPIESVVTLRDTSHLLQLELKSEELRTAQIVQRQLYPEIPPRVEGFRLAGKAIPATQACGDYFDFITSEERSEIVLTIGDVTGHGLGPALQMVETRAYLRAMIHQHGDLKASLTKLNEFLVEDTPEGSFISLMAVSLDPESRTMRYVGAGHDGWLFRANGRVEYLPSSGLLLGLLEDSEYEECGPIEFHDGDLLFMVTDGLPEAFSGTREMFGSERMIRTILNHRDYAPADLIEAIVEELYAYVNHRPLHDDITLVVARADFDD